MPPDVILVDDDPEIVQVICDLLQDEDIDTGSCPHGHQAYACIRGKQPRLVILDVQMPGVDGIEIFQMLRADPATARISVIFVTANARHVQEWLPNYKSLGATLLPKPFDIGTLVTLVHQGLVA